MSLLNDLIEQVMPTEEVTEEPAEEQEEIKLDGFIQLQMALREIEKEKSKPLQDEISRLESKMAAERAIVDAYTSYDVAKAAKEPDFDRSAAAGLAANADVAAQILSGLEDDLYEARSKLDDIHTEHGRLSTLLTTHGNQMDTTRRAVAIEYARNGKLKIDKDHAARWLNIFAAAQNFMEKTFGEKYQDAVDHCLAQLSSYSIPSSTTTLLFEHLNPKARESYPQFNNKTNQPKDQKS